MSDMRTRVEGIVERHLERIRNHTTHKFTISDLPAWIEKNTFMAGKHFSFRNHEYQQRIIGDQTTEKCVRKCSQVGLSEINARGALGIVSVQRNYTVIYTLPTSSFAATFMQTRINPVIEGSASLSEAVHPTLNNSEIKQFGESFLYVRGCQSNNAPISVPADHLVHDEVDFSDQDTIDAYQSRLTASPHQRKDYLSTPTAPGTGIDNYFSTSRRHFNMVKCCHCNHQFIPSFFDHVHIPGYTGELWDINRHTIKNVNHQAAVLLCPRCGKEPDLGPAHREWVCENPLDNYSMQGYQVSPFDAPNIPRKGLSVAAFLVEAKSKYVRTTDFVNFNLGLPSEDKESAVMPEDVERMLVHGQTSAYFGACAMGIDMGLMCNVMIGAPLPDGTLLIIHKERVPAANIRARRKELMALYRPRVTVADNVPYTETIMAMQTEDANLYGAWYQDKVSLELYNVKQADEDKDKGKEQERQIYINRSFVFDSILFDIRADKIKVFKCPEDEIFAEQMQDMKRVRKSDKLGDESFTWRKGKGNDHYHHSLLYTYIASKIMGMAYRPRIHTPPVGIVRLKKGRSL